MFRPDSFLIRFLTRVCDLLFLNVLFVLSCATLIFSGTAVTSLYCVTLKMIRKCDCSPVKSYLRALRENFLPSAPAAVLLLLDAALLAVLRRALYASTLLMPPVLFVFLCILAFFLTAFLSYLFPLIARFDNSFARHAGNAARLAAAYLPVTFLLTAVNLMPLLLGGWIPSGLGVVIAFWLLFGFAAGAYLNSFYLDRIFGG